MNNIRLFNSLEEYNNSELQYPQVSFIEETNEVILEKYPPTIIARYVFDEDIPARSYPFYQETTMSSKVTSFKVNGVETLEEKPLVVLGTYTPIATGISEELEGPIFTEESLITGAERVRIIFSKKPDIIGLYLDGMGNASQEISEWIDLFGLEVVSDTEYILNLLAVASSLEMDYSELTVTVWGCGNIDNPEGAVEEINSFNTIIETISGGYTTSGNQEGWQAGEYEVIIHLDRHYPSITELFKLNSFIREVRLLGNFNNFDTSFTFNGCSLLETTDLSKSNLKELGESAFSGCSNLISINLPESMTSIGEYAFYNCFNLNEINIPESVTSIGDYAFQECISLARINIPEGVTSIRSYTFRNCNSLTSINIPKGVTSIGEDAFSGCTSLASINLPEGMTSIGEDAFYYCYNLTDITIPESVTSIGPWAFCACASLTNINIPEGVTSIGNRTFSSCSSLTSITIHEGIISIGREAFSECNSLTAVHISNIEAWCKIEFKNSSSNPLSCAHNLYLNGELVTNLVIPESVMSIGDYAFNGCSSLAYINIPESVTSIGECAFQNCTSITTINIPESVTRIGWCAFDHCISMIYYDFSQHTSVPSLDRGGFIDIPSTCQIRVPSALYDEWIVAENWSELASNIVAV